MPRKSSSVRHVAMERVEDVVKLIKGEEGGDGSRMCESQTEDSYGNGFV